MVGYGFLCNTGSHRALVIGSRSLMNDELRLSSGAFERHNREPRRAGGLSAKIATNNVKTQVQALQR